MDGASVAGVSAAGEVDVLGFGPAPGVLVGAVPGAVEAFGGAVVVGGTDGNGSTFGCLIDTERGIAT